MGGRGYIGIQRLNYEQKSKRRKLYDPELKRLNSRFQEFIDYKKMNTHEFADFQKGLFKKRNRERKNRLLRVIVSIALTILFLFSLPYIFSWIFS